MPLFVRKRKSSTFWRIRGTIHGVRVDRSSGTRSHEEATRIAEAWAAQIYRETALGKQRVETFAEIAVDYLRAGHDLGPRADEILVALGNTPADKIATPEIDALAAQVYPNAKPSTINRNIIAPISACLHWGSDGGRVPFRRYKRRKERDTATDWRRPGEIERILDAFTSAEARALAAIYVGCGLRASEAVFLDGREVASDLSKVTILGRVRGDDQLAHLKGYAGTKSGRTRTIPIPPRARALIAPVINTGPGRAFVNSLNEPWSDRNAIAKTLRAACRRADIEPMSVHALRHTFATWHNAVFGDPIQLMQHGGWTSLKLVERYAHAGDNTLRGEVRETGWAILGQSPDGAQLREVKTKE